MLAIYCRISKKKEEGQDKSIETQKKLGIQFATEKGWNYRVFVDEGISGANDDIEARPEFAEMLNLIRKENNFTAVFCIDQSRIERNSGIWNIFVGIMLNNKCEFYPDGKFFDLNIPENIMFAGMLSLTNEFYASLTSRKVKLANELNAKEGKTHGQTAYGYQRSEKGFFEINQEEAIVVKRIFNLSLEGIGTYTIANRLNLEGIPTKFNRYQGVINRKDDFTKKITTFKKENVRWRGNVLYDMLKNPIYKGLRRWKDQEIKVPAILEVDLWDKVNKNLTVNKKNAGKREEYHYLLNGLIYCADCGSEFRGKKRLKGKDSAYKCKGKSGVQCNSRGINIAKIETFIIHHLFISKELETFLVNLPSNSEPTNLLKEKLLRHQTHLNKTENKVKRLRKLLIDDDLEDDEHIKNEYIIAKKTKEDTQKNIEIFEKEIFELENDVAKSRLQNAIGNYEITTSFEETRKLIHSLIEEITLKHNKLKRGGYFKLEIKYKGFPEYSIFSTSWQAMKWHWISRYRSTGFTDEEVQDEIDALKWRLKKNGIEFSDDEFKDYEASERLELGLGLLQLKLEDLIYFD